MVSNRWLKQLLFQHTNDSCYGCPFQLPCLTVWSEIPQPHPRANLSSLWLKPQILLGSWFCSYSATSSHFWAPSLQAHWQAPKLLPSGWASANEKLHHQVTFSCTKKYFDSSISIMCSPWSPTPSYSLQQRCEVRSRSLLGKIPPSSRLYRGHQRSACGAERKRAAKSKMWSTLGRRQALYKGTTGCFVGFCLGDWRFMQHQGQGGSFPHAPLRDGMFAVERM